jgi:hypothetical protein
MPQLLRLCDAVHMDWERCPIAWDAARSNQETCGYTLLPYVESALKKGHEAPVSGSRAEAEFDVRSGDKRTRAAPQAGGEDAMIMRGGPCTMRRCTGLSRRTCQNERLPYIKSVKIGQLSMRMHPKFIF